MRSAERPPAGRGNRMRAVRGLGWEPFGWMGPGVPMQRFDSKSWPNDVDPAATLAVASASDGGYELAGLAPETYALAIRSPGRTSLEQVNTVVRAGALTRVRARLVPAGALQLVVDPNSHVGAFPKRANSAVAAFVASTDGACLLPDLAPGRYVVASLGLGRPWLADATNDARRTTWVDARNLGKHELRWRVLAGALVGTVQRTTPTDERGRARMGALQLRSPTVKVFHWRTTGEEAGRELPSPRSRFRGSAAAPPAAQTPSVVHQKSGAS